MTDTTINVEELAKQSKQASRSLGIKDTNVKNDALRAIADALGSNRNEIIEANKKDLEYGRETGLSGALLDRLRLTPDRIDSMIDGIEQVISLDDPVGEILEMKRRPNGLKIGRQRVPLGVIGIIYESRPNVTVDAAVLSLKAGNATILRGGSEAQHSNYLLVDLIQDAIDGIIPRESVQILRDQDHELVDDLLSLDEYLDVIVPRGGEALIETVAEQSTIPVIKHYEGICHTYISDEAEPEMANDLAMNAKTQRTSVCNAMETLIVHDELPESFVGNLLEDLASEDVELRLDEALFDRYSDVADDVKRASEEDWSTEYLDSILSVREVSDTTEAIEHINQYGNHSDAIVTEDYSESEQFLNEVDSAAVYVNASTRFTDGYEFGLGAEIGISTERLHARGPMGLRELTIPKYIVYGQGQTRT